MATGLTSATALTLADAGKKVYLVEREPTIGGHMAMFDKTFPTLDCAACILTPKMTAVASQYYSKLPAKLAGSFVLMIDPMLATGGSAVAALDLIKRAGASDIRMICIVAAPEGVALVEQHHPDVHIYTPVVDSGLNEHKFIVPGLGDFGDRLYGTE